MGDFDDFNTDSISVRTLSGGGGMGGALAAAVVFSSVQVDEARRIVTGPDASETVSDATVYDDDLTHESSYTFNSEVTLPSGRVARVIVVKSLGALGVGLPAHLEVSLT